MYYNVIGNERLSEVIIHVHGEVEVSIDQQVAADLVAMSKGKRQDNLELSYLNEHAFLSAFSCMRFARNI